MRTKDAMEGMELEHSNTSKTTDRPQQLSTPTQPRMDNAKLQLDHSDLSELLRDTAATKSNRLLSEDPWLFELMLPIGRHTEVESSPTAPKTSTMQSSWWAQASSPGPSRTVGVQHGASQGTSVLQRETPAQSAKDHPSPSDKSPIYHKYHYLLIMNKIKNTIQKIGKMAPVNTLK